MEMNFSIYEEIRKILCFCQRQNKNYEQQTDEKDDIIFEESFPACKLPKNHKVQNE